MIWMRATSVRRNPALSASKTRTREHSGKSMPSRRSWTPTRTSRSPLFNRESSSMRSLGLTLPVKAAALRGGGAPSSSEPSRNFSATLLAWATELATTRQRSPRAARRRHSAVASSSCAARGRTSTVGSQMSVGRTTSLAATVRQRFAVARVARSASSSLPGVADTKTASSTRCQNSPLVRGRLSRADGRRKPYSTSVCLRARSPAYMAPNWPIVRCDSSTKSVKRGAPGFAGGK
mmetsp:Transcript_24159/g.74483  ORF Transcript_24159/g.74483 Transcript_24159/m.74483 type:complete len:235 (-) Transcript_24159:1087-1791(-)